MTTEGVGLGTQAAFEIHLEEVQEIDQSLVLDLQYTNHIQASYLKSEKAIMAMVAVMDHSTT